MLRNAIRHLEQRRPAPCRAIPLVRQTLDDLLRRRGARNFAASHAAVTTAHDEGETVSARSHDKLSQSLESASTRHPPPDGPSPTEPSNSAWSEESPEEDVHTRASRRIRERVDSFGTHFTTKANKAPAYRSSRKSILSDMPVMVLLEKIFEPSEETAQWRRYVARERSSEIPIIMLQVMIRRDQFRFLSREKIIQLLPNRTWPQIIKTALKNGHNLGRLNEYAYILRARTDEQRCGRFFVSRKRLALPRFIFSFLIRPSSTISQTTTLNALIEEFRRSIKMAFTTEQIKEDLSPSQLVAVPGRSRILDHAEFGFTLKHLAFHCIRIEPRLMLKLADVAAEYIQSIANLPVSQDKIYRTQCIVFNNALRILQPQPHLQAVRRSFPNDFLWEAQRTLLAMSAKMNPPLLVGREEFQAIRNVLSSLPKNHDEMYSSLRHAPTWPPYFQAADGMDEAAELEDQWSRALQAGILMQEAGFAKDDRDDALDILNGMAVDGTPTIQQRAAVAQGRKLSKWEASIRATRNAHEAWERFRNPPEGDLEPGLPQYAAMFEKLFRRGADAHARTLPGDKALNFPVHVEPNLTDFEKARLQPPSVAQLYDRMRSEGIRPRGTCLHILVANADSLETAHTYLNESDEGHHAIRVLFAEHPDPRSLMKIDLGLFAAYIQVLTTHGQTRGARKMMRAIRMSQSRVGTSRSPLAQLIWGTILKNLSQHHLALRISLSQQFHLIFHALEQMSGRDGVSLSAFLQFGKCMRKAARFELAKVAKQMASDGSLATSPLLRLYGVSSGDETSHDQKLDVLLKEGAARMKELYHGLKQQERESQDVIDMQRLSALDRMVWRKDVTRSDHAHEYMLSLAYVGEFDEMAVVLRGVMEAWGQADVVQALGEVDEPPAHADFFEALCAFRLLGEPMVERGVVESLRGAIAASGLGWKWPDGEALRTYVDMQEDESIIALAQVLEWARKNRSH